ncbi:MAG: HAD-IC family P-type ATPase, partial [Tenericutes bacterium]|nr:HAD-IC family P-type ATPase [Mycoplasmatota bacterium]
TKSIKQIIHDNTFTYFNMINIFLLIIVLINGIVGNEILYSLKNSLFIGVIVCNTIIGIAQEIISKKTIDRLSVLSESKVNTVRNGKMVNLSINEIVLDDVVLLNIGNQVVTDTIIIDGEVEVNESFITGEEEPIIKKSGDMILSGSFITSGKCYGKVEHIGKDNYISSISSEVKYIKKVNSIILKTFNQILKVISVIIIPLGIALFYMQFIISNNNFTTATFATVAALIGMIPEGLILLTSSVMAVSVIRLSKYNVLVQQLYCIETLARVDIICLDKTGTITEGKMELYDVITYKNNSSDYVDNIINEISYSIEDESATFLAIKEKYIIDKNKYETKKTIPFSSKRKFLAIEFEKEGSFYIGAPEFVLKNDFKQIKEEVSEYQKDYRVLVLAKGKELSEEPSKLEVLAFILIRDKIRKEAASTIKYFKDEDVSVKIISGDNLTTVMSIASRSGLDNLKGIDTSNLTDKELEKYALEYDIFARVSPEDKRKLIKVLQKNKHVVAMTGDGVNDVLALKEADCSIAMASGSEAARNVSQLVLLDSNFDSLPKVLLEGRRTINNIGRSSSLLLMKTIYTIILIIISIVASTKYFFVPIQLTLITAFTIGIPSFVLALEPNKERVKGNFLFKIISRSLPAALTVVFNISVISLLEYYYSVPVATANCIIVFLTGATGFIYLFKLSKPFNKVRIAMYTILLSGFLYSGIVLHSFFDLPVLTFDIVLVTSLLIICSLFVFEKLDKVVTFVLVKTKNEI